MLIALTFLCRAPDAAAQTATRPTDTTPWDVAVVSLEAKGPHCILAGHTSGQILRLGDPAEFDEEGEEDDE